MVLQSKVLRDEKSLHMEKEVVFLGMSLLTRKRAQTFYSTVQKKWKTEEKA